MEKETREQIAGHLKRHYVTNLRWLYGTVSGILRENPDFLCALEEYDGERDGEDMLSVIEEDSGKSVDLSWRDVIAPEELEVLRELETLARDDGDETAAYRLKGSRALRKPKLVEMLSKVFGSDALSEGFFLLLEIRGDGADFDAAGSLAEMIGCPNRWQVLSEDPVYCCRRDYGRRMARYVKAALNLYGCLHVESLAQLIDEYELPEGNGGRVRRTGAANDAYEEYVRAEGGYRRTVFFTPQWRCVAAFHKFIDCCIAEAGETMDGLVVHECFREAYNAEQEQVIEYIKELGRAPEPEELRDFLEDITEEIPYRMLYEIAAEKERYVPKSKKSFLRMADGIEPPAAQGRLRELLRRNYKDAFDQYAYEHDSGLRGLREFFGRPEDACKCSEDVDAEDVCKRPEDVAAEDAKEVMQPGAMSAEKAKEGERSGGMTGEEALDRFMAGVEEITGNGPDCVDRDAMDIVHGFADLAQEYGIKFQDESDVDTMLQLLMEIQNNTRLWVNNGHTPAELARQYAPRPGQRPVIVPGSTAAAQMLSQEREKLEQMGIHLDLDSNADEIPVFSMPGGGSGPVERSVRKIYPNDPCPCGSGKKYKKCCGRNR